MILIKASEREILREYYQTKLLHLSSLITDNSTQSLYDEIDKVNKAYRDIVFFTEDPVEVVKDIDEDMTVFKKELSGKEIKFKIGKPINQEFDSLSAQELIRSWQTKQ